MLKISTLLTALVVMLLPARGLAQTPAPPVWDLAVTTGLFEGQPGNPDPSSYGDDWYDTARAGISVGRYWTANLKTEVEVMASGEGMRYAQRFATLPGSGTRWPYVAQEYFRLHQGSARVVWQLLDNQWIHPYVLAGVTLDADRQRTFVPEQLRYSGDYRQLDSRELLVPQFDGGPDTFFRAGAMVGAGAKLYMSPRAFANAGVLVTQAKPAKTVSLVLGLGLDF